MNTLEYRVAWRREGLAKRTKIYQDRPSADRWALILQGKMQEATGLDHEAFACCSGSECGCGGRTNAEVWAERRGNQPDLVELTIDERRCTAWRASKTYPLPAPKPPAARACSCGGPETCAFPHDCARDKPDGPIEAPTVDSARAEDDIPW